jgi:iron complex transport system ATP-binding protein
LSLAYGSHRIIERLSLELHAGSWTSIVGPNGSGKSTLLRALSGLLAPCGGGVWLDGRPLAAWPRRERAKRIAWLSQVSPPSELTASQCVALGRFAHTGWLGHIDHADEAAVREAMMATGSLALAGRRLSTLSGGERQRIHLARVLAVRASVLLLDEPTTHLDPPHQEEIARILRSQAHEHGATVLCAIHDLPLALLADRLIVIGAGGLVGHGAVSQALAENWLSQAFGTVIRITEQEGAYLWHPHGLGN